MAEEKKLPVFGGKSEEQKQDSQSSQQEGLPVFSKDSSEQQEQPTTPSQESLPNSPAVQQDIPVGVASPEQIAKQEEMEGVIVTPTRYYNASSVIDDKLSRKYTPDFTTGGSGDRPEVTSGKFYTSSDVIKSQEEKLKELTDKIDTSTDYEQQPEKWRAVQEKNALERSLQSAKDNNDDILAAEFGSRYYKDGEELSRSEMTKYLSGIEYTTGLKDKDLTVDIKVDNDPNMDSFIENQKLASEVSWAEGAARGFASTAKNIVLDGLEMRKAEVNQGMADLGLMSEEQAAVMSTLGGYHPKAAAKAYAEAKVEVERDPRENLDFGDAFLRNYAKGIQEVNEDIRGAQTVKSYDVIDLLSKGEMAEGASEIGKMGVESLPFTLAAMTGWGGTAMIANSVQAQEYYSLRNEGVDKQTAFRTSGLAAIIETADAALEAKLFTSNLKAAKGLTNSTGAAAGYSKDQIKRLGKNVLNSYAKELPTEFTQGTLGELNRQWGTDEEIDFNKAVRMGAIESMATLPSSTVIASPSMAKLVYAPIKKQKDMLQVEGAIGDLLMKSVNIEDPAQRKAIFSQLSMLADDYVQSYNEVEEIKDGATKEDTDRLKTLTRQSAIIEKTLTSVEDLSEDNQKMLEEKLDTIEKEKEEVINNVKTELDEKAEQTEEGAVRDKEEVKTEEESIKDTPTETSEEIQDPETKSEEVADEQRQIEEKPPLKPKTPTQKKVDKAVEGKIDPSKKVAISEKAGLKKQIQDFARGMREAAKDQKEVSRTSAELLKDLKKSGKINSRQVSALTKAALKVNFSSAKSVSEFTKRVENTIKDLDYNTKLETAKGLRGQIKPKKNSLGSDKVRVSAFRKIDPLLVEDIGEYTKVAQNIKNAVKSNTRGENVVGLQSAMDYDMVDKYIKKEEKNQEKLKKESLIEQYSYLGEDALTLEEMDEITSVLESEDDATVIEDKINEILSKHKDKDKRKKDIDEKMNRLHEWYREPLKDLLKDKNLSKSEREVLETLSQGDISKLHFSDKARAVNVMENILYNGDYSAAVQVANIASQSRAVEDVKKTNLKIRFGRGQKNYMKNVASFTVAMKHIFNGQSAADKAAVALGITDFDMGAVKAHKEFQKIVDKYNNLIKDEVGYNTTQNIVERRIYSYMGRNAGSTSTEVNKEFQDRKDVVLDQAKHLEATDSKYAKEWRKVVDDMGLEEADTVDDLKVSDINKKSVDFFVEVFEDLHESHAEVAKMVFNKILPQDSKYLPDIFKATEASNVGIDLDKSVYFQDAIDVNETSMLQKASKRKALPKDKAGNVSMILDPNFDTSMMRKVEEALLEIHTAAAADKINKSATTEAMSKMLSPAHAEIFKHKLISYVNSVRGSQNDTWQNKDLNKAIDFVANFAATKLLGSLAQPIKQSVAIARSVGNAPKSSGMILSALFGKQPKMMELAEKYGTVSFRGKQSTIDVESLKGKLKFSGQVSDKIAKIIGEKGGRNYDKLKDGIAKAYETPLEYLLEKPDKHYAMSSWVGFYADYMRKNDLELDVDKELESPTKEAVQYANARVSETQNESQIEKMGDVFKSRSTPAKLIRNIIFPFASFQQNLRTDLYTNIGVATSKTASVEDKNSSKLAIAAILGEMAIFNIISLYLNALTTGAIASLLKIGGGDDEEKEISWVLGIPMTKKQRMYLNTNILSDIAPLPLIDKVGLAFVETINKQLKKAAGDEYDKFEDSVVYAPDLLTIQGWEDVALNKGGKFGSTADLVEETATVVDMADVFTEDGTYTKRSAYGSSEKPVYKHREEDVDLMLALQALYMLTPSPRELKKAADAIRKDIEAEGRVKTKKVKTKR